MINKPRTGSVDTYSSSCLAEILARKSRNEQVCRRGNGPESRDVVMNRDVGKAVLKHGSSTRLNLTKERCAVAAAFEADFDPADPGEQTDDRKLP